MSFPASLSRSFSRRRSSAAVTWEELAKIEDENRAQFSGQQLETQLHGLKPMGSTRLMVPVSVSNESPGESLFAPNRAIDEDEVVSTSCVSWLSPGKKEKHAQRVAVAEFANDHTSEQFSRSKHEDQLQRLWRLSRDQEPAPPEGEPHPQWKTLGFQGDDPASDLSRSNSGVLSVKALIYFASSCPSQYNDVLERSHNEDVSKSYPFACAAMHLTDMLLRMVGATEVRGKPGQVDSQARKKLANMMVLNKASFFDVFCISFILLDAEWQRQNGTYFQFNAILESVRVKLVKTLRDRKVGSPLSLSKALQLPWRRSEDSSVEPSPRE